MNKPVIEEKSINGLTGIASRDRWEKAGQSLARFRYELQNLEKAAIRITASTAPDGGTEPAAVAWLLRFLRDDLEALTAQQQEETQWDVARFSLDGGQGVLAYGSKAGWGMGAFGLKYPETVADWLTTLKELQHDCREVLDAYLYRGEGMFPAVNGTVGIFNGESLPRYRGEDLASGFYYMGAQLLSRYGHRVKRCEGCMRTMLVGRKDQRFHSQSCQVASFNRSKRANDKADRLAKEHAKKSRTRRNKKKVALPRGGKHHGTTR